MEEAISKMELSTGNMRNKPLFKQVHLSKNGAGTNAPAPRFTLPLPAYSQ
jgi:hypothetical protein